MRDPIVQIGAAILRQKAKPIAKKEFGSRGLSATIQQMKKTLAGEEYGVAIAAPQIGKSLRIFIVAEKVFGEQEVGEKKTEKQTVFINPELIRLSRKKHEMSEGCLSVRGKYGSVIRHEKATVRAQDKTGKPFIYHASGLVAHIFQHEVDHLNGILYVDKAKKVEDEKEKTTKVSHE